jgi:hypothetical protein
MIRPQQKKLYSHVHDLTIPDHVLRFGREGTGSHTIDYLKIPLTAFVRWPTGKPCDAVNIYLLENSYRWTGKTCLTVAAKLTEFIRYCSLSGRRFDDIQDADISAFVKKLCEDTYIDDTKRLRNNNSIRAIIQTVLSFLYWYQQNLSRKSSPFIGKRSEGASVIIEHRKNSKTGRNYIYHRYLPPSNSTDPKLPISTGMIEKIEHQIETLYFADSYSERARRRFGKDVALFDAYRDYVTARREFMIFVMRRTGLRPEEMSQMSFANNLQSVSSSKPHFSLPTLKRRKLLVPIRQFPISEKDGIRAKVYFLARDEWFECCKKRNLTLLSHDAMFLSTESGNLAAPVNKTGLEKDFEKLCNKAGYKEHQSCFSMFRHRFITDLVMIYLKEWHAQNGELAKQDYRTLLEKVREKTGHKSVESLWHYIDLARSMQGVWEPIDNAVRRLEECESLKNDLVQLHREIADGKVKVRADSDTLQSIIKRLETIINGSRAILTS